MFPMRFALRSHSNRDARNNRGNVGSGPLNTVPRFARGFNLPYICDYITKSCKRQAKVIENHENEHVRGIGQGEARHIKYERHKLGSGQTYDRSSD
jgi:hypothetical protein